MSDASGNGLLRMRELAEAAGSRPARSSTTCARASCPSRSRRRATWRGTRREFVERVQLIKQLQEERFLPLKVIKEVLEQGEDEGGSERLRALIELEDRVLERALSGQDAKGLSASEVAKRYGLPEEALDRLEKLEVLTPTRPQRRQALRARRRADHRGGQPHARVRLLRGARLHRVRHADLQAPPRSAGARGGRGDDGAGRGRDGHRRGGRPARARGRADARPRRRAAREAARRRSCRRGARRSSS